MRKYLYYIKDGNDEMKIPTGEVRIQEKPLSVGKGDEVELRHRSSKTGKSCKVTYVGLGYKDVDSEEDFEDNLKSIIKQKVNEVGLKEKTKGMVSLL